MEAAGQVQVGPKNTDLKIAPWCRLEFKSGRDYSNSSRRGRSPEAELKPQPALKPAGWRWRHEEPDDRRADDQATGNQ
jgi:hypothetical protein